MASKGRGGSDINPSALGLIIAHLSVFFCYKHICIPPGGSRPGLLELLELWNLCNTQTAAIGSHLNIDFGL